MTKQELKQELLRYNRFLHGEIENTHLVEEYLNAIPFKTRITIEKVVDFVYNLFEVNKIIKPSHDPKITAANNELKEIKIQRAEYVVSKYLIEHEILDQIDKEIFKKIFKTDIFKNRKATKDAHVKTSYVDKEMYGLLCEFLKDKLITWALKDNKEPEWLYEK
jgi:hypothetical protein